MSKLSDFLGSLGKLAGVEHAERVDRQNILVFHDEMKGGTVFDRNGRDDKRSAILFRGFPENGKTAHLKGLVRLLELRHYQAEGKADEEELAEATVLTATLTESESEYTDIASVLSVHDVATVAGTWS